MFKINTDIRRGFRLALIPILALVIIGFWSVVIEEVINLFY